MQRQLSTRQQPEQPATLKGSKLMLNSMPLMLERWTNAACHLLAGHCDVPSAEGQASTTRARHSNAEKQDVACTAPKSAWSGLELAVCHCCRLMRK